MVIIISNIYQVCSSWVYTTNLSSRLSVQTDVYSLASLSPKNVHFTHIWYDFFFQTSVFYNILKNEEKLIVYWFLKTAISCYHDSLIALIRLCVHAPLRFLKCEKFHVFLFFFLVHFCSEDTFTSTCKIKNSGVYPSIFD